MLASCLISENFSDIMIQIIIASLLLVISIELLKIVRSLIVLTLSFFKETPEESKIAEKAKDTLKNCEQKHKMRSKIVPEIVKNNILE